MSNWRYDITYTVSLDVPTEEHEGIIAKIFMLCIAARKGRVKVKEWSFYDNDFKALVYSEVPLAKVIFDSTEFIKRLTILYNRRIDVRIDKTADKHKRFALEQEQDKCEVLEQEPTETKLVEEEVAETVPEVPKTKRVPQPRVIVLNKTRKEVVRTSGKEEAEAEAQQKKREAEEQHALRTSAYHAYEFWN